MVRGAVYPVLRPSNDCPSHSPLTKSQPLVLPSRPWVTWPPDSSTSSPATQCLPFSAATLGIFLFLEDVKPVPAEGFATADLFT